MKLFLSTAYLLLSVATLAFTAETIEPPISADQLLQDVVTQLPAEPIKVSGTLMVRRRRGMPVATYRFELNSEWGKHPAQATYKIEDNFGQSLEQLTITHGQQNSYQYSSGNPLITNSRKNLSSSIQNTDLSWTDLSLAFLWWRGAKIIGEESVSTYNCYIVEVDAPTDSILPYASTKIWISKKYHFMLQVEGYDAKKNLVRRLWIKNFKKINDQWMVKDMEIQKYPKSQITKLRVLNIDSEPQTISIEP